MKFFIERKMHEIFKDFQDSLDEIDRCCILKDVTFQSSNIPDYSLPQIQQLYLLKYFPAYLVEYYHIYKSALQKNFLDASLNILSIGTGCGVDYCGLEFAFRDHGGKAASVASYTGVDKVRWKYRDKLGNKHCYFLKQDITEWEELDEQNYNIIIFPKSIGEFNSGDFSKLLKIFEKSSFDQNKIFLISSVREQSDTIDVPRLGTIIDIFVNVHGFTCLDDKKTYRHFKENVGLRKLFPDFVYPQDILDFIANLLDQCEGYRLNKNKSCEGECESILNRSPILKTDHVKYQIKRLEKA